MALNVSPDTARDARLYDLVVDVPCERVTLELTEHDKVRDYEALRVAEMVAISSRIPGPMTFRISSRGMIRGMMAVSWTEVCVMCGVSIMTIQSPIDLGGEYRYPEGLESVVCHCFHRIVEPGDAHSTGRQCPRTLLSAMSLTVHAHAAGIACERPTSHPHRR